jgi:hypothetical protein
MAQQYLIDCVCGKQLPVGVSQAGGAVTCECGAQLTVPTLGALRQLPPVQSSVPAKPTAADADWNAQRGGLFAGGVLAFLFGVILSAYGFYQASQIDITDHSLKLQAAAFEEFDRLQYAEVLDLWKDIRHIDIANTRKASHLLARENHRQYRNIGVGGLVIAVVGTFGFLSSLLGSAKPKE